MILENEFMASLKKELRGCGSILDLGCGKSSPLSHLQEKHYSIGVDLFKPFLEESRSKRIHDEYIQSDILKINFKEGSFEAVVALDVLEHLTKKEGLYLIKKMNKFARKKVIIFTPNGFIPQEKEACRENYLQLHKCGWKVDELKELGFKVYGINGWKPLRGERARIRFNPKIFWEIISKLTQIFTYKHPEYAFQLFCVKDKNGA